MSPNPNQTQSPTSSPGQTPMGGTKPNGSNMLLYMVALVVVVVIVIGIVLLFSSGSSVVVTQNHSVSSIPIYLSSSQAGLILNSQLQNYNTGDLFSPTSVINMSFLKSIVPNLAGNVTSGWITSATGANQTANASIEYMVFETTNATHISGSLYSVVASSYNITAPASYGTQNGLSYSYGVYKNATSGAQVLSGWKNNGVVLLIIQSYPSFTANETSLVRIAANETP